ncbi:MAG: thiol-activated cytolysin family protein, partial [Flavobacteriales bacterium]
MEKNYKLKNAKKIAMAVVASFSIFSCQNDDMNTNLGSLQKVAYELTPDTELSAVATGVTATDPNTGIAKKEYLVTTEKSALFSKGALTKEYNIESTMLYPGSILNGASFMNRAYDPLVLSNPFKPVSLFLNIKGRGEVKKDNVLPKGSTIFQALSDLQIGNANNFPTSYIPANYTFESTEITNEESFKKAIGLHVKANYFSFASASFGYDYNTATTQNKKYVMMKLNQTVYSAGIDPKYQTDWIDGAINTEDCGTHEPLYISSVDYGRVAYILIETEKTTDYVNTMVNSSLDLKIGGFGGSVNQSYSEEFKSLFDSNKVKVSVLGGPSNIVTNY